MTSRTTVALTILHFSDVYEIAPVSGGRLGGLARLATLRRQLAAKNPNTLVLFAGDFYTPSGLGTAIVDGSPLDGQQTVAIFNQLDIDCMTFGDHEFHVHNESAFYARLSETAFPVISSNLCMLDGQPFPGIAAHKILTVTNQHGAAVRIGVFGITKKVEESVVPIIQVDPVTAAAEQVDALRTQVDLLIALTHQPLAADIGLAHAYPAIDLILGGDDHEAVAVPSEAGMAPIYKSDANARTVYVLDLAYDTASQSFTIDARQEAITDALVADDAIQAEVERWTGLAYDAFRDGGIEPTTKMGEASVDLNGVDNVIRNGPTALTDMLLSGMRAALPTAQVAVIDAGLMRLDDCLPAGSPITTYDLIRLFPKNYRLVLARLGGHFLCELLDFGAAAIGTGHFMLLSRNVHFSEKDGWLVDSIPINVEQSYLIAAPDCWLIEGVDLIEETITLREVFAGQLQQNKKCEMLFPNNVET
ncbi:MAG: metallophosphoesterase [Chloroflexota bacterium]